MVVHSPAKQSKEFIFSFTTGQPSLRHTLRVNLVVPAPALHVPELAARLVKAHDLPVFVEADLKLALESFIVENSNAVKDEIAEGAIASMKDGRAAKGVMELADAWTKTYSREWRGFAKPEETSDTLLFSEVYHSLIHSTAMQTLLHIEHRYALAMSDLVRRRDEDLDSLELRQEEEMGVAVAGLGTTTDDETINALAARHFDAAQVAESKWASEVFSFREAQRREYRSWVMQVNEDVRTHQDVPGYLEQIKNLFDSKTPTPPTPPVATSNSTSLLSGLRKNKSKESPEKDSGPIHPVMEESFTIHLGTQMKTSFNLRLLCCDVIDHLCLHRPMKVDGQLLPSPQRLQTAMGLYANSLTGMILLVDCRLNSFTGVKRRFARACDASTDFHFDDLETQFSAVKEQLEVVHGSSCEKIRVDDSAVAEGDFVNVAEVVERDTSHLEPGDFYVTRHSNLARVHAVFHLAMDDSVRDGNLTSRHYSILSIRNILKLCTQYDITTICIPLLLTHEMCEEMTIPWCIKRAELIFKCVKGFMMEMASWNASGSGSIVGSSSGQRNREIQFIVPPGIDDNLFQTFCSMLPDIFRLSNPLVVKSTTSEAPSS